MRRWLEKMGRCDGPVWATSRGAPAEARGRPEPSALPPTPNPEPGAPPTPALGLAWMGRAAGQACASSNLDITPMLEAKHAPRPEGR